MRDSVIHRPAFDPGDGGRRAVDAKEDPGGAHLPGVDVGPGKSEERFEADGEEERGQPHREQVGLGEGSPERTSWLASKNREYWKGPDDQPRQEGHRCCGEKQPGEAEGLDQHVAGEPADGDRDEAREAKDGQTLGAPFQGDGVGAYVSMVVNSTIWTMRCTRNSAQR